MEVLTFSTCVKKFSAYNFLNTVVVICIKDECIERMNVKLCDTVIWLLNQYDCLDSETRKQNICIVPFMVVWIGGRPPRHWYFKLLSCQSFYFIYDKRLFLLHAQPNIKSIKRHFSLKGSNSIYWRSFSDSKKSATTN